MPNEVECPTCGKLVPFDGYNIGMQAYVGTCVPCGQRVAACFYDNGNICVMMLRDEPKQETWRDRAIRDPMM
jgi:hypothetical protein